MTSQTHSQAASLGGKTLFITGASRGIGLAIARRAAADGANIVIVAKTTDPNPKLPGTIYSAAQEVEAAGGHILSGVSSKLNYLVVGDDAGSKLEKAKKIATIKIITEADFVELIKN